MVEFSRGTPSPSAEVLQSIDDVYNVAYGYITMKILKPMVEIDMYELIAHYGSESMNTSDIPYNIRMERRIEAIHRYAMVLRLLISNSSFLFKDNKKNNPMAMALEKCRTDLDKVEPLIPHTYKLIKNPITNETETRIREDIFSAVFSKLRKLKEDISYPMNKAGLIFKQKPNDSIHDLVETFVRRG